MRDYKSRMMKSIEHQWSNKVKNEKVLRKTGEEIRLLEIIEKRSRTLIIKKNITS